MISSKNIERELEQYPELEPDDRKGIADIVQEYHQILENINSMRTKRVPVSISFNVETTYVANQGEQESLRLKSVEIHKYPNSIIHKVN